MAAEHFMSKEVQVVALTLAAVFLWASTARRVHGGFDGDGVLMWTAVGLLALVVTISAVSNYRTSDESTPTRAGRVLGLLSGVLIVASIVIMASDFGPTVGEVKLDFSKPLDFLVTDTPAPLDSSGLAFDDDDLSAVLDPVLNPLGDLIRSGVGRRSATVKRRAEEWPAPTTTLSPGQAKLLEDLNDMGIETSNDLITSLTANLFISLETFILSEELGAGSLDVNILPDDAVKCFKNRLGPSLVDPGVSGNAVAAALILAALTLAAAVCTAPNFNAKGDSFLSVSPHAGLLRIVDLCMNELVVQLSMLLVGLSAAFLYVRIPTQAEDIEEPVIDGHNMYTTRAIILGLVIALLSLSMYAERQNSTGDLKALDRALKYACVILSAVSIAGAILLLLVETEFKGLNDFATNLLLFGFRSLGNQGVPKGLYGVELVVDALRPIIAPIFYGVLTPVVGVCSEDFANYQTGTEMLSAIGPLALLYFWRAATKSPQTSNSYDRL